ncbi:hypothetical protein FXO37_35938 [Capsicum annuum]|nr:hypothetical protein FXO37_35938 [Capsicum annuum]
MASVFLYHVVGDLTVGKAELVEFTETQTVEAAIKAIGESTECGIPVWKTRSPKNLIENAEMRRKRFLGILNSLDIVAFLAREECLADQVKAMKTPVSEVVVPNSSLLKELDPATSQAHPNSLLTNVGSSYCIVHAPVNKEVTVQALETVFGRNASFTYQSRNGEDPLEWGLFIHMSCQILVVMPLPICPLSFLRVWSTIGRPYRVFSDVTSPYHPSHPKSH